MITQVPSGQRPTPLPTYNQILYLQHRCDGPHPIPFDITLDPNRIRESATIPFDPAHCVQPAS